MRNGAKNMQANEVLRLESGGVLSLYVPPKTVRGVVLICPGGGYQWVAPREGEPVAVHSTQAVGRQLCWNIPAIRENRWANFR